MSLFIVNQEANANFLVRRARDFKRFSITSVRSPVSMALELATARRMLARETDTLSELFLRTMGRLRNEMIGEIITLARHTVASGVAQLPVGGLLIIRRMMTQELWGQSAESDRLETEIKRHLGGLGYEC
ncbi:MAG: hypothetical protein CMG92_08385 [Marinobacter sp.]|nr:hypothetical protein [Marinobacter sp.]MBH92748.1 hypothetical protein [Marinobacter sp.]